MNKKEEFMKWFYAYYRTHERRIEKLCKLIVNDSEKDAKILDIGSGAGHSLLLLRKMGFENLWGVDINDNMIKFCRIKGLKIKKCNVENQKLPLPDNSFDIVILSELIEHLREPKFMLKEIRRVIKNKGILWITTPNQARMINRIKLLFGKSIFRMPHMSSHVFEYTVNQIKDLLGGYNFKLVGLHSTYTLTTKEKLNFLTKSLLILINTLSTLKPSLSQTVIYKFIKIK